MNGRDQSPGYEASERGKKAVESLPAYSFRNKHGEEFIIHSNGTFVMMSGDEVNMMVKDTHKLFDKYISLFNPDFCIWEPTELYQLGQALMFLGEKPDYR